MYRKSYVILQVQRMNPKNYKEGTVTVIRKEYSPIRDGNVFMGEEKYVVQNIVARSNGKDKN